MFNAVLLEKDDAGFRAVVQSLADERLPALAEGEVKIAVEYSTLNYKDGLAITNRGPASGSTESLPHASHHQLHATACGMTARAAAAQRRRSARSNPTPNPKNGPKPDDETPISDNPAPNQSRRSIGPSRISSGS